MYAIVKTGGKQYRVEQGQWLLVERLPAEEGATIALDPLLIVDGETLVDGDGLAAAKVQATVLGHERGPKLRVVKFKPKRGYKRRTGHRQNLTRIQITEIAAAGGVRSRSKREPAPRAEATAATKATEEAGDGA
jgi:large subunit ribosomal protein L21